MSTQRRIDIVEDVLELTSGWVSHSARAVYIVTALDADARRRPFIGIVPPVRALNERDTPGVYPGLDEFHKDTSHNPEA